MAALGKSQPIDSMAEHSEQDLETTQGQIAIRVHNKSEQISATTNLLKELTPEYERIRDEISAFRRETNMWLDSSGQRVIHKEKIDILSVDVVNLRDQLLYPILVLDITGTYPSSKAFNVLTQEAEIVIHEAIRVDKMLQGLKGQVDQLEIEVSTMLADELSHTSSTSTRR